MDDMFKYKKWKRYEKREMTSLPVINMKFIMMKTTFDSIFETNTFLSALDFTKYGDEKKDDIFCII